MITNKYAGNTLSARPTINYEYPSLDEKTESLDEKEILKQKLDGNKISWLSEDPRPGTDSKLRVRGAEEEFWRPHPLTHSLLHTQLTKFYSGRSPFQSARHWFVIYKTAATIQFVQLMFTHTVMCTQTIECSIYNSLQVLLFDFVHNYGESPDTSVT